MTRTPSAAGSSCTRDEQLWIARHPRHFPDRPGRPLAPSAQPNCPRRPRRRGKTRELALRAWSLDIGDRDRFVSAHILPMAMPHPQFPHSAVPNPPLDARPGCRTLPVNRQVNVASQETTMSHVYMHYPARRLVALGILTTAGRAEQKFHPNRRDQLPDREVESQALNEKPLARIDCQVVRVSGGDDTFINFRFGDDGKTFPGGKRFAVNKSGR